MKITKGMKAVVVDNFGNEYEGVVENVSDYREPSMKYAVDIGWDDFVFVGENSIHPTEKGGVSDA